MNQHGRSLPPGAPSRLPRDEARDRVPGESDSRGTDSRRRQRAGDGPQVQPEALPRGEPVQRSPGQEHVRHAAVAVVQGLRPREVQGRPHGWLLGDGTPRPRAHKICRALSRWVPRRIRSVRSLLGAAPRASPDRARQTALMLWRERLLCRRLRLRGEMRGRDARNDPPLLSNTRRDG